MVTLLKDYEKHTTFLGDQMPLFDISSALQSLDKDNINFYYLFYNTQSFYNFLQEEPDEETLLFFEIYKRTQLSGAGRHSMIERINWVNTKTKVPGSPFKNQ